MSKSPAIDTTVITDAMRDGIRYLLTIGSAPIVEAIMRHPPAGELQQQFLVPIAKKRKLDADRFGQAVAFVLGFLASLREHATDMNAVGPVAKVAEVDESDLASVLDAVSQECGAKIDSFRTFGAEAEALSLLGPCFHSAQLSYFSIGSVAPSNSRFNACKLRIVINTQDLGQQVASVLMSTQNLRSLAELIERGLLKLDPHGGNGDAGATDEQ